jgi:hypothetical protein
MRERLFGRQGPRSLLAVWFLAACLPALLIGASPEASLAAQVSLAWNASADAGLAGYKLHYGTASRSYTAYSDAGKATSLTVTGLQDATAYYFAATAYDSAGMESSYSTEVSYTTATSCSFTISPTSASMGAPGGRTTVSVTAPATCAWTVADGISWITIASGANGAGNGSVVVAVSSNTGAARSAGITVAGNLFSVSQTAATPAATYTITASAGTGGAISPSGSVSVASGAPRTFWIRSASGYRISGVDVDGVSAGTVRFYTFTNVKANHTIRATFVRN